MAINNTENIEVKITLNDDGYDTNSVIKGTNSMADAITGFQVLAMKMLFAFGKESVATFQKFEYNIRKVQAVTSASNEEMKKIEVQVKSLAKTTGLSAIDIADATYYMGLAGWNTEQILAGMPAVLNLAKASGEDLSRVSDIVTDSLTAFGLTADDTMKYVDLLANTSRRSNTTINQLGDAFKYVAPISTSLGVSAEDTAQYLGLLANAGIKASKGGTVLRSMLSRMSAPTKMAKEAIKELGIQLFDSKGKFRDLDDIFKDLRSKMKGMTQQEQSFIAKNLAGQTAMAGFLTIINSSEDSLKALDKATTDYAGASDEMVATMMNSAEGINSTYLTSLEAVKLELGEALVPTVNKVKKTLSNFFNFLVNDGVTSNEEMIKSFKINSKELVNYKDTADNLKVALSHLNDETYNQKEAFDTARKSLEEHSKATKILLEQNKADSIKAVTSQSDYISKETGVGTEKIVKKIEERHTELLKLEGNYQFAVLQLIQAKHDGQINLIDIFNKEVERLEKQKNEAILKDVTNFYTNSELLLKNFSQLSKKENVKIAGELLTNSEKTRDALITNANKTYEERLKAIQTSFNVGLVKEQQYTNSVLKLQKERSLSVNTAIEDHKSFAREVKKSLSDVGVNYDTADKKAKSFFESMWEKVNFGILSIGKFKAVVPTITNSFKVFTNVSKEMRKLEANRKALKDYNLYLPPKPNIQPMGVKSTAVHNTPEPLVFKKADGGFITKKLELGNLQLGENGTEAIVPVSNQMYMKPFAQAIAKEMPNNQTGNTVITGNNFYVRTESDIQKIAIELQRMKNNTDRKYR